MAQRPSYTINRRALMADLDASEPILKKEAERIMREQYFLPAVAQMRGNFEDHLVTQEIGSGPGGVNISSTLEGNFTNTKGRGNDDTSPNLFSFIGFDAAGGDPLDPIRKRLDPTHPSGPKLIYRGKEKSRMIFHFEVRAPSEQVIYNETPMPWAKGSISWAKRIEQGIPGIAQYLNVKRNSPDPSRSGTAIQIDANLPNRGRFRPVSYLSGIFREFLRRAAGGR